MSKSNLPKTILILTFLIAFTLIAGLFIYGYLETKKAKDFTVSSIEPVKNNQKIEPEEFPTEPAELETYEAELFIEAEWGDGEGEVGLFSMPLDFNPEEDVPENENLEGISYGPQSFDINDNNDHLFLLDSVNERVLEYDENGKYLKNFQIACGGTGDIRISPDYKLLYIWSNRCGAIYKYDIKGELLESYPVTPGKNPGIGNNGMAFDENGNIMLDIQIEDYLKGSRFYQIGKTGGEWKENNYFGFISKDGTEYYKIKGIDQYNRFVQILNKKDDIQKEFLVELPQEAYVYYSGCDKKENIYLNIGFKKPIIENNFYSDEFIWKYNRNGNLLTKVDLFSPLRKLFKDDDFFTAPRIYLYANNFIDLRIDREGNIYWLTSFKDKGLKIFKYSKTINYSKEELKKAEKVLNDFFSLLNNKDYKNAVKFYGGGYELLREYNPYEDSDNYLALLRNWCEYNGGNCLKHKIINKIAVSINVFKFTVEFFNEDGSIFTVLPPWPLEEEGISIFSYTIKKVNNNYKIMGLPPYTP